MFHHRNTIVYGFVLFAMFFGSEKLVFPLQIGLVSDTHWFVGFLGLVTTGILLPFLGLFVIKLYEGSYKDFFGQAGVVARHLLPLFTLSLMGSFGVFPSCIAVAYGGIKLLNSSISLGMFSLIFCFVCYLVCLKDLVIIRLLGKWMSPLLLIALIGILVQALFCAPPFGLPTTSVWDAFSDGFVIGYQTMDLFLAFFFSSFIFMQLQAVLPEKGTKHDILMAALPPSIFGILLLAVIYMGLACVGAHYKSLLAGVLPELMLPTVANIAFGTSGAVIIAVTILLTCFTTAVALNNIYAHYICSALLIPETKFYLVLAATTIAAFFVSLLDFKGIEVFLAPILEVTYPSMIALTVLSIITKRYKTLKMVVFYGLLVCMSYWRYMSCM